METPLSTTEIDMSSHALFSWFSDSGTYNTLSNCSESKTYGRGEKAITLAMCPQVKDPLPYVSAGLASIETKYADYFPETSILGMRFNGTTKGVLPQGWNSVPHFNHIPESSQPHVQYNHSLIQQGVSVNVSCQRLGLRSNITWHQQGEDILTMSNGISKENVYVQNMTFGPNSAAGIDFEYSLLVSGDSFVYTFSYYRDGYDINTTEVELASYGSYDYQWKLPNMTCAITPYVTNVNVTYNNASGLFNAQVVDVPGSHFRFPAWIGDVDSWYVDQSKAQDNKACPVACGSFRARVDLHLRHQPILY